MTIDQWLIAAVVFAVLGILLSGLHSYQLRIPRPNWCAS